MITCSQVPRNIAGLYSDFWAAASVRIASRVTLFTVITKETKTTKIFFSGCHKKSLMTLCIIKKLAVEMKTFWRAVSVNYFRGIHLWEESAGSQRLSKRRTLMRMFYGPKIVKAWGTFSRYALDEWFEVPSEVQGVSVLLTIYELSLCRVAGKWNNHTGKVK